MRNRQPGQTRHNGPSLLKTIGQDRRNPTATPRQRDSESDGGSSSMTTTKKNSNKENELPETGVFAPPEASSDEDEDDEEDEMLELPPPKPKARKATNVRASFDKDDDEDDDDRPAYSQDIKSTIFFKKNKADKSTRTYSRTLGDNRDAASLSKRKRNDGTEDADSSDEKKELSSHMKERVKFRAQAASFSSMFGVKSSYQTKSKGYGSSQAKGYGSSQQKSQNSSSSQSKSQQDKGKPVFQRTDTSSPEPEDDSVRPTFKTTHELSSSSPAKAARFQAHSDLDDSPIKKPKFASASDVDTSDDSNTGKIAVQTDMMKHRRGTSSPPPPLRFQAAASDIGSSLSSVPGSPLLPETEDFTSDQKHSLDASIEPLVGGNNDIYFTSSQTPCCPVCKVPVGKKLLEKWQKRGLASMMRKSEFCREHKRKDGLQEWKKRGYPEIKWRRLDSRIRKHHGLIRSLLDGEDSFYRQQFSDLVSKGLGRSVRQAVLNHEQAIQSQSPGYYGSRGLQIMSESIMQDFSSQLRKRAIEDQLVAARGVDVYVQSVLVPEVAIQLIMEDMGLESNEARTLMEESSALGDIVNEELDEHIERGSEDSSEPDEWA